MLSGPNSIECLRIECSRHDASTNDWIGLFQPGWLSTFGGSSLSSGHPRIKTRHHTSPSTSHMVGASKYIANVVLKIFWPLKHHQFEIMFFMIKCFFEMHFYIEPHPHLSHPTWQSERRPHHLPPKCLVLPTLGTGPAGWWKWRPVWASQS